MYFTGSESRSGLNPLNWLPEAKLAGIFHRQQLFHCQVALLFFMSVAVLGAEERLTAVWSNHLAELNQRVPAGFVVVVQPPFVVIGDEATRMVWSRATNTVKRAVDELKQEYFKRDPAEIIDIWLFADRESYTNHAWRLFRDTPTTPFGYYSAQHRALVMNIATGGGTLVHEIVHPFMRANFPECPAWFNEGMGSLYEQCGERKGRI